ncbi:hypothetical protein [Lysobacter sp. HA35]
MPRNVHQRCKTCSHPERERIEQEIAIARSMQDVADRWGIERRSLNRHRADHMTQEQIARLRGLVPADVEVDIAELTRRGGEDAMLGLKRLNAELVEITKKLDGMGEYAVAAKYRDLEFKIYREQMKIAALYPGLKQVTNNNLVFAEFDAIARLAESVLGPWPEARRAFAQGLTQLPGTVIDAEFREAA